MTIRLIKPDHLIVIARTLAEGVDYVTDTLRVAPTPVETASGTGCQSARLALWQGLHLEVIAAEGATAPAPTQTQTQMQTRTSRWQAPSCQQPFRRITGASTAFIIKPEW